MATLSNNPVALLKAMIPRIPLIIKTVILHGLRMSPVSGKQDLRTELTVAIIRSFITYNLPVGKLQKSTMRDPGVKGPLWVAKVTLPQPEDDVRDALIKGIEDLKTGDETYDIPDVLPVEAEWTGYRSGKGKDARQPDISEEEKYKELRKEAKADSIILYFHGGAYFLMDPSSHRVTVSQLSKSTGAPVLSVRYRLAPQNPFPSALLDALVAYLSLISPPPGSLHSPIPANKIVLSGDSAGGNLSIVLLQTLLTLRRVSPTIRFHGKDVPIDLPAGVATTSPWCDVTRSMPSVVDNDRYDYIGVPSDSPEPAYTPSPFPEDDIWPSKPPRAVMYANANALLHPLVSPLAGDKEIWKGAPPVYMSIGEEGLTDEGLILARKMQRAGVRVVVDQFEGMPHCFGMIMMKTPAGLRYFETLARFCQNAIAGTVEVSGNVTYLGFKLRSTKEIPIEKACELSDEEALERMRRTAKLNVEKEKELVSTFMEKSKL